MRLRNPSRISLPMEKKAELEPGWWSSAHALKSLSARAQGLYKQAQHVTLQHFAY